MSVTYSPPLEQLLTLGKPEFSDEWLDYRALGLGEEHVPALIGLMHDPELDWLACKEGDGETPFWAPLHAWRALGRLRAQEAADPLVGVLMRSLENDWASEDIPEALAMIGPAALRPLRNALPAAARQPEPWIAGDLGSALVKIAKEHPQTRDEVVGLLTRQLRVWPEQDEALNAFLVGNLVDLDAVEAAPVMQEAFEAGAVDESVLGDWEDVQMALGLLSERTTPAPRFEFRLGPAFRDFEPAPVLPAQRSAKAAAKKQNRRKAARQSRKKNRRRR